MLVRRHLKSSHFARIPLLIVAFAAAVLGSSFRNGVAGEIVNSFELGPSWESAAKTENGLYSETRKRNLLGRLKWESPFSPIQHLDDAIYVQFSNGDAKQLALRCKARYPAKPWNQIACVSSEINVFFAGKDFGSGSTFCRSHAAAFRKTFIALQIPRSNVSTIGVYSSLVDHGHVVSRVAMVSESGQPYAYVIDVGNYPNKIFPLTEDTIHYHRKHLTLPSMNYRSKLPCKTQSSFDEIDQFLDGVYEAIQSYFWVYPEFPTPF